MFCLLGLAAAGAIAALAHPRYNLAHRLAWLLALSPAEHAGRAFAAYGGVYIAASLLWLWLAEGRMPDRWDLIGGALALVAAGIILFAPRGA